MLRYSPPPTIVRRTVHLVFLLSVHVSVEGQVPGSGADIGDRQAIVQGADSEALVPLAIILKGNPEMLGALPGGTTALGALDWQGLLNNLIPVTLGNMVGGTLMVAGVYWFAYLRNKGREAIMESE